MDIGSKPLFGRSYLLYKHFQLLGMHDGANMMLEQLSQRQSQGQEDHQKWEEIVSDMNVQTTYADVDGNLTFIHQE